MLDFWIACTCTITIFKPEKDFWLTAKFQDMFCIKNKTKATTRSSSFQKWNSPESVPIQGRKGQLSTCRLLGSSAEPYRVLIGCISILLTRRSQPLVTKKTAADKYVQT